MGLLGPGLGEPCVMNIWTGDGFKDIPADRMGPRMRCKESIDETLSEAYDFNKVKPCIESKVFGIGVEAYTAGSGKPADGEWFREIEEYEKKKPEARK